jgi:hypothetical protein
VQIRNIRRRLEQPIKTGPKSSPSLNGFEVCQVVDSGSELHEDRIDLCQTSQSLAVSRDIASNVVWVWQTDYLR